MLNKRILGAILFAIISASINAAIPYLDCATIAEKEGKTDELMAFIIENNSGHAMKFEFPFTKAFYSETAGIERVGDVLTLENGAHARFCMTDIMQFPYTQTYSLTDTQEMYREGECNTAEAFGKRKLRNVEGRSEKQNILGAYLHITEADHFWTINKGEVRAKTTETNILKATATREGYIDEQHRKHEEAAREAVTYGNPGEGVDVRQGGIGVMKAAFEGRSTEKGVEADTSKMDKIAATIAARRAKKTEK